jgi:hypothetical protein
LGDQVFETFADEFADILIRVTRQPMAAKCPIQAIRDPAQGIHQGAIKIKDQ